MCGIAGYVGEGDKKTLHAMADTLRHRGPDGTHVWTDKRHRVGLAHNRLAIIDLSQAADQPMTDSSGRYTIVFNGEMYNYKELRSELKEYPFKTNGDTEVILAAYAAWGTAAFSRLRGMFALAIYDAQMDELTLVRDRLGKKPLYYFHTGDTLVFGSELKALRAHPLCPTAIDTRSLAHYLSREYVPTPRSIYRGVQKLQPASYLTFDKGVVTIEPYWNPYKAPVATTENEALKTFHNLLEKAVSERLVSDVPLGIFLSGGLDSSTIAYYASRAKAEKIKTFSIGFTEKSFDESGDARLVAKHLGTEHYEKILSANDALALLSEIPEVFDEPVADASVLPTLLLSRFTREHVTVALGGDGADELLLGYHTFKAEQYAAWYGNVPEFVRNGVKWVADTIPISTDYFSLAFKAQKFTHDFDQDARTRHLKWLGSFSEESVQALLLPEVAQEAEGVTQELIKQWRVECPELTGWNGLSHQYLRTYLMDQVLVKVDRASMHYGLEVRSPFLSHDLVEFLLALPPEYKYKNGRGKHLLRELMREKLPTSIIDRSKKGFAAPVAAWLRGDLKDICLDTLSESNIARTGLMNPLEVSRLIQEHMTGSRNHGKKLWTLLVFQLWYNRWIKG